MLSSGVLFNTLTVVIGSLLGLPIGKKLAGRYKDALFIAVGSITLLIGVKMGLETSNFLVALGSLAIGVVIGESMKIEDRITALAKRFSKKDQETFAAGFVFATVLFVVGPMTILGCVNSGLTGNNQILYLKSMMDGISSMILASVYGFGVLASAASVFFIEGGIVIFSSKLQFLTTAAYLNDFTGVGGAVMLLIGIRILNVKEIKVGNFLPALVVVPILDLLRSLVR